MEINSTKHIQVLPVAQKRSNPIESSLKTGPQNQSSPAISEKTSSLAAKPTKRFGYYEKGSVVDTYA
jgi:hypothetical protein